MKISEFIQELQKIQDERGDLEVIKESFDIFGMKLEPADHPFTILTINHLEVCRI